MVMRGQIRSAKDIVAAYALMAGIWIVASDLWLGRFEPLNGSIGAQIAKGLFFVAVTSALLYLLVQRRLRAALASERKFRSVVDSMGDGVLILDRDARVSDANRAALSLFGVQDAGDLQEPIEQLSDNYPIQARTVLEGHRIQGLELVARRSDGKELNLLLSAAPVWLDGKKAEYAVFVLRDITPFVRLEKMRDEFLSTAAHELKTPLAVIKANNQLLLKFGRGWSVEKTRSVLEMVDRQCDRSNQLIQELLELSRANLNQLELRREPADLSDLVKSVVKRMQALTQKHDLRFESRLGAQVVSLDVTRIEEVLYNLLDNAIKFSPAGGVIWTRIDSDARNGHVRVTVEDPGIGIPFGEQPRVFDKFYSSSSGVSDYRPYYEGMGIGLSLCREIVRKHGGSIGFESVPGKGSKFYFELPIERGMSHGKAA